MKKIVAVIRSIDLERTEKALRGIRVEGITVIKAKGYGEYKDFFTNDWIVSNIKLEIVVSDDQVDEIIETLRTTLYTGCPGDGVISVSPIEEFIKISTGERLR